MSSPMTEAEKKWIDEAAYETLLGKWRFAAAGDPMFTGDTGQYYIKVMVERRAEVGPQAHTAASKSLGWEK